MIKRIRDAHGNTSGFLQSSTCVPVAGSTARSGRSSGAYIRKGPGGSPLVSQALRPGTEGGEAARAGHRGGDCGGTRESAGEAPSALGVGRTGLRRHGLEEKGQNSISETVSLSPIGSDTPPLWVSGRCKSVFRAGRPAALLVLAAVCSRGVLARLRRRALH